MSDPLSFLIFSGLVVFHRQQIAFAVNLLVYYKLCCTVLFEIKDLYFVLIKYRLIINLQVRLKSTSPKKPIESIVNIDLNKFVS
jgi:hypothetical protein